MKVNDNHYKYTIETKNEEGSVVEFQEIETIEPIRSVRDVYDELDLENNIQIKRIEEIIFNSESSEYWYIDTVRSQGDYVVAYIEDMNLMCHPDNHFCDTNRSIFEYGHFNDNAYLDKNFFCTSVESNGMSRIYMKLLKSETSHEQFTNDVIKAYLAEHPVTVWYVLRHEVVIPRSLSKGYVISHEGSTTIDVQPQTMGKVTPVVKAKIGDVSVEMDSVPSIVINNTTEGNQLKDLTFEGVTLVNNANGDNVKGTKEVSHTRYDFAPFYDGSTTINNTVEGGHVSAKLYGDTMINIAKPYGETQLLNFNGGTVETVDLLGENTEGVVLADGELTEGRIYGNSIKGDPIPTFTPGGLNNDGTINDNVNNHSSEVHPVPNRAFTFTTGCKNTKVVYYDTNMTFISYDSNNDTTNPVSSTPPSNAVYVRYGAFGGDASGFTWIYNDNGESVYSDGIKSVINPTVYNVTKNLFDYEAFKTQEPVDGSVYIPIKLKKATTYHIISDYSEWNGTGLFMYLATVKDGSYTNLLNLIDSNGANAYGKSFHFGSNYDNYVIKVLGTNRDGIISKATKIGIFEGSYYEHEITPHKHSEATFPYTLNKLPNGVADYIDVVNKVHVQRVGKFVADGVEDTLALETYNVGEGYIKFKTKAFISRHAYGAENFICDKLPYNSKSHNDSNEVGFRGAGGNSPYWIMFCIEDAPLATKDLNGLRAYLQSNPITVLYELATPIYTPLTDEEIAQLPLSAYKDGYVMLSSDQLVPSMDLRMKASNRYQVDMLETNSYYYLNAPVGNIKLGRENVNVTSMPCIIKTGLSLSGDSDYRLGFENVGVYFTYGKYVDPNGALASSTSDVCTDYLVITDETVGVSSDDSRSSGFGICIAFYDESRNFITRASSDANGVVSSSKYFEANKPSNAKYCRISYRVTKQVSRYNISVVGAFSTFNPITLAKLPSHRIPSSFTQGMKCATDFGYWEGIKEAQIWSLGAYNSSGVLTDKIFTTGLENAGTLNRFEGTYQTSATIEDEFDYATGKLIRRIGKLELNSTNVEAISHINVTSKEYLYVSLYGDKLGGNFGTSLTTNKNYGLCITDKTSFSVSYGGDFNHSFIAGGNIVLNLKTNEFGGIPTIQGIRDYFSKHPLTIYYEMAIPEISYITDLLKNYVATVTTSTKLLANVKDKNLYLYPQCKPSPLSYPTSLSTNTQYTVFHNRKNYSGSVKTPMIDLGGTQVPATGTRTLVTTPSTLTHNELRFIGGENTVEQVMVLHGDWTKEGKTVDYFEGMQSSVIGNKTLENLVKEPVVVLSDSNISYTTIQDIKDKYDGRPKFNSVDIMDTCKSQGLTLKNLLVGEPTKHDKYQYNFTNISGLKQNTVYTLMFDINQQFNSSITSETTTGFFFGILDGNNADWNCVTYKYRTNGVQSLNTRVKTKITTANSSVGTILRIASNSKDYVETFEITNAILLEGDYTNLDIPYFEGMQSVRMPVLKSTGKNLFDYKNYGGQDINIVEIENGLRVSTWATSLPFTHNLLPNTIYTSKSVVRIVEEQVGATDFGAGKIYIYNGTTYFLLFNSGGSEYTFKTPSDIKSYNRILFYAQGGGGSKVGVVDITNMQIEEGSTATSYEPFKSNILSTPSDFVLRGTGEYKDVIDWKTGSVGRRTVEFSISGDEGYTWTVVENTKTLMVSVTWSQLGLKDKIPSNSSSVQLICDKLPWNSGSKDEVHIGCDGGTPYSNTLMMYLDKSKFSTFTSQAVNDYIKSIGGLTIVAPLVDIEYETVDLVGGGNWDKIVLDGSQNMVYHNMSNGTYLYQTLLTSNCSSLDNDTVNAFSSPYFEPKSANDLWYGSDEGISVGFNGISGTLQLRIKISTVQELKQYLSENPITVWYQTSTVSEQTSNTDLLFFDNGSINLTSSSLPVQSYDRVALPTNNRYIINGLDTLKYTVITNQPFYLNGVDYPASSTGLTVIDILSVTNKELYSDDKNITLVQDDGNYYANGVLTQFKGSKEFVKEFIVTNNGTKRTGMKLLEPIELNGIPNSAKDIYEVEKGIVTKNTAKVKFKDMRFDYTVSNSETFKNYTYSVYVLPDWISNPGSTPFNYIGYGTLKRSNMLVEPNLQEGYYLINGKSIQMIIWNIGTDITQLTQKLLDEDFTVVVSMDTPQITKVNDMKPYISTRPEKGSIESLDSKLQAEYLDYDNEQYILSPRMLGEGDTIRWEQGSQCYVFENDKEYIPLEDYREPFGSNLDAKDVEQYIENVEGAEVELGIALKEKGVYERTFASHEDSVIYSTELDNIDEQRGTEVEYICGATWQNPNDLSDIRHLGTLRPDGQYDVNIVRSGDDEIRLLDGTTNISLNGDGLNPSEFELTYYNDGGAELGKYGDTNHTLEGTVKDSKLATGTVYGETLVNLVPEITTETFDRHSDSAVIGNNCCTISNSETARIRPKFKDGLNINKLKPDTFYTVIVNIKEFNLPTSAKFYIGDGYFGNLIHQNYSGSVTSAGIQTVLCKTEAVINSSKSILDFALVPYGDSVTSSHKVTFGDVVVLEGDYTQYPMDIPYFEGVGSTIINGFTMVGKNLLDLTGKDFDNKDVVGTVCSLHNGIFTIKGLSRGSGGRTSLGNGITFLFKKGKTYTLSIDVVENNATTVPLFYFSRYDNSSAYISTRTNNNPGTITATEDVLAYIGYNVEKDFYYDCKVKVQIEYGTQATEFEPYQSEIQYTLPTPITLNKVGDIADTFNVVSGVETRKLEKIVFDDNVDYYVTTFNNTTKYYYVYTLDFDSVIIDNAHTDGDYIATVPYAKIGVTSGSESSKFDSLGDITFTSSNSGTKVKFIIEKSLLDNYGLESNTQNAKAYFRDNPVSVIITRKTPITIQHTLIPSHQPVEYPTFILPQPLRSVPNGICDRLYWDENKGHYCIEKRIYDYTITGANDVGLMDSGTSLMVYAYGDASITDGVLNLNSGNVSQAPSYSYNNKFGNKVFDVITGGSTVEAISPFNGHMYYRLLASRVGTTLDSIKAWFNENPTTVYMPLATPQIIDLPHLNRKLEMPTLVDGLPLGFKVEHEKANPQLGLTIPYKVLNMPKQPTDLNFVMRDNQIGDYILTWSEIKEARQYNIILNDSVIATTKEPSYNTGEEIYGYILVEAQNELGENLSKELYVKTVPNAPAQLTVAHNPMTDSYDFDITFISTSAIADYYTIKYCVDDGDWVVHDIQATDIELDSKVLYQFSVFSIEDNIKVHATATNDIGTNDILPVATYYMSPTPQWTYRINSKEAFIRWIDNSPYDVKYKVRYSYLSEGVYKYAYFEGDTSEVGKMYELMLPLAEDDELTVSICIVSDKENLYCKPVKMSKSLDPNIVPPLNFKYRWLARGLIEFSWEDNYEVDVKYEYVLEHKLADADVWEAINEEIMAEDVAGIGTVYRLEYQLQDLEQIRVKVRMLWAMNETEWTETLATVFIPVEGNPPTWIKRTQTQEGLLVQWEAQAYVDSYHVYITDAEGTVLQQIETLDDFILLDIDYDNPIELHIYEKTRFSGGIESDPTDEMVFTPTSYRTTHLMNIYKPCAEEYEMEVATIQKAGKVTYVINDVTYTPNVKATGDLVTSISSPFQISYHPLGIDVHQAGSKAYAPLDLSVRTLDVRNKYQFDIMTFERITDKYGMNFNVYTPSVMSYPITLEVSKVRIVCLGDSLTSGHPYYWAETGTGMVEASYPYQLSRRLKNQFEVINSGYGSDTTDRCLARFERDVLRYKPQYCLFQCGTNDLYWAMAESLNNQEALDLKMAVVRDNTMEVVKRCWDNGIIPIIGTLIPRTGATGIYKTALFDHNKWIINWCNEQSAAGRDIFYVDFFNAGKDVTPPTPLEDPTNPGAMNPIYDGDRLYDDYGNLIKEGRGIHLNPEGYKIMASAVPLSIFQTYDTGLKMYRNVECTYEDSYDDSDKLNPFYQVEIDNIRRNKTKTVVRYVKNIGRTQVIFAMYATDEYNTTIEFIGADGERGQFVNGLLAPGMVAKVTMEFDVLNKDSKATVNLHLASREYSQS